MFFFMIMFIVSEFVRARRVEEMLFDEIDSELAKIKLEFFDMDDTLISDVKNNMEAMMRDSV